MNHMYRYLLIVCACGMVCLMYDIGDTLTLVITWVIVALNVPFGAWRGRITRTVLKMIPIHAPIPIIWVIRAIIGIELSWVYIMMAIPAALLGQRLGEVMFTPKKTEEAV